MGVVTRRSLWGSKYSLDSSDLGYPSCWLNQRASGQSQRRSSFLTPWEGILPLTNAWLSWRFSPSACPGSAPILAAPPEPGTCPTTQSCLLFFFFFQCNFSLCQAINIRMIAASGFSIFCLHLPWNLLSLRLPPCLWLGQGLCYTFLKLQGTLLWLLDVLVADYQPKAFLAI